MHILLTLWQRLKNKLSAFGESTLEENSCGKKLSRKSQKKFSPLLTNSRGNLKSQKLENQLNWSELNWISLFQVDISWKEKYTYTQICIH